MALTDIICVGQPSNITISRGDIGSVSDIVIVGENTIRVKEPVNPGSSNQEIGYAYA